MNKEKSTNPQNKNRKEKGPIIKKEVARIFLLQAISVEDIKDNEDFSSIYLTRLVMAKKSDNANNPGQIMPIGGEIQPNLDVEKEVKAIALRESHLIFENLRPMPISHTYEYTLKGERVINKARYFIATLYPSPYDIPYALNPEEDKINNFVSLDNQNLETLFNGGSAAEGTLQDALLLDEEKRKNLGTIAATGEIEKIKKELEGRMMISEAQKKLSVLSVFLNNDKQINDVLKKELKTLKDSFDKSINEKNKINIKVNCQEIEIKWKEFFSQNKIYASDFKKAYQFSNLQEVMSDINSSHVETKGRQGKMFPTVAMMFPVLFGQNFDKTFLEIFKSNLHLAKVYAFSRVMSLYSSYLNEKELGKKVKLRNILENIFNKFTNGKAKFIGESEGEDLLIFFRMSGMLKGESKQNVVSLTKFIDSFFNELQSQSRVDVSKVRLGQSNEVLDKSLKTLLTLAFRKSENKVQAIVSFEAQRKLIMMMILHEAESYYNKVTSKRVEVLDGLEEALEVSGSGPSAFGEKGRSIKLKGVLYPVIIDRREKTLSSLFRKVFIRDVFIFEANPQFNDLFGEALVFEQVPPKKMLQEERLVPENLQAYLKIKNSNTKDISPNFKAEEVIYDYILSLAEIAKVQNGRIEILDYKPIVEGESFQSNSVGGGASIRMCKFYIKYIDENGQSTIRETQVFLPKEVDGVWVSGKEDYNFKKEDDISYSLKRLFTQGMVSSFMELFFPASVYGQEIKMIYADFFKKE